MKAGMTSNRQPRRTGKRPYGPNIVRAWFDTVFHYVLSGLEMEKGFLVRRNWTFRQYSRTLEYIAPVGKHVPAGAIENLEQFVSFFPEVDILINRHDESVQRLQGRCVAYAEAIVENAHFLTAFRRVEAESPQVLRREFKAHFGAYSSEEAFRRILAEYLVNNVGTLDEFFSTAALWNHYREDFMSAVSSPELTPLRDATDQAGRDLIQAGDASIASMKRIRSELSLAFDVPFVAELSSVR
jgi:hypothetical protein